MAKKSKAERKAIRKEGWKQAAQGLHEMYGKSSLDTLAAMGKGFTKGAASGISRPNENPRTNAVGKAVAGLGGALVEGIKNIPNTVKTMAKGNWNLLKGVFKGIFNHPDWYAYKNVLSVPAYNAIRPFDPNNVESIMGAIPGSPGIGVCHVVKQNVSFSDVRDTESFKLAAIEAFKDIRLDLKSNLPYTQNQYNDFVGVAISVCAKAKALERVLGWYNVTRADIPELQKAMLSVPASDSEIGKVSVKRIACVDEGNYASTLNKFKKLQSICRNIAIPHKLADFISWWLGSVFIDQGAVNPQLYVNELRSCPIYGVSNTGELISIGNWDIATGSIDEVINEALALLDKFGIMNADIIKTGRYGFIQLADVDKGLYNPITLSDPEYFTILINSYGAAHDDTTLSELFNGEYIRVDVLDGLNSANLVGVTNALATWAKSLVPFKITSQAAYLTSNIRLNTPRNLNVTADLSSDKIINQYFKTSDDYWYQLTSVVKMATKVKVEASGSSIVDNFTPNAKYYGSGIGTISAMGLQLPDAEFGILPLVDGTFTGTMGISIGTTASNTPITVVVGLTGGTVVSVSINSTPTYYDTWTPGVTGTNIISLVANTNYTTTQFNAGNGYFNRVVFVSSTLTIPSAGRTTMLSLFTVGSNIRFPGLFPQLNVTSTTTTVTASVTKYNFTAIDNFCDLVDYHLPLITRENMTVSDGTHTLTDLSLPVLKKSTYIPLIFNKSDIEAVLYWMYLGLFSM